MALIDLEDMDRVSSGKDWANGKDKTQVLLVINAWLNGVIKRQLPSPVPEQVIEAGLVIAPLAAAGTLFKATDKELSSKSVEASGVKTSKAWREGSQSRAMEENVALALLSPWTKAAVTGIAMVRRS